MRPKQDETVAQTIAGKPEHRPNYLWAALVLAAFLIWLAFNISFPIGAIAILVSVSAIGLTAIPPRYRMAGSIGLALVAYFFLSEISGHGVVNDKIRNAMAMQGASGIQVLLEKYENLHGEYPSSIGELVSDSDVMLDYWPRNLFSDDRTVPQEGHWLEAESAMKPLNETGWPLDGGDIRGNFLYLPQIEYVDGEPSATSYTLVGFGADTNNFFREKLCPTNGAVPIISLTGNIESATDTNQAPDAP